MIDVIDPHPSLLSLTLPACRMNTAWSVAYGW